MTPLFWAIGAGHRRLLPLARALRADLGLARDHRRRVPDGRSGRLPRRHRRLRLLALLHLGPPDAARRTTPSHGAYSWRDYFKVNTDHKVIGDPVPRDDVLLLRRGRPDGDDLPRRAREPGHAVRRHADVQRARVGARGADDLPLHHPRVRRARELRRAADAGRAGHGLPAPERALVLAAADRRDHVPGRVPRPGRRVRRRLDGLRAALRRRARTATSSSRWASSGPVRRRS